MATEVKNSGSGTWQVPIGQECTLIEGWGAGGGGGTGGGGPGEAGSGGGGGGYFSYTPGAPIAAGTNINYSVGTGGAGDDARDGEDGIAGGATTVSTYSLTANGGGAGKGSNSGGASGGTASGGTTNTTGGTSSNPGGGTGTAGGAGANGGAGGSGGGTSSPAATNGTAPGGGGGGGGRNTAAGDGAAGRITFTYSAAASGSTYNETGDGGSVGGSSALPSKTFNEIVSGGIVGGDITSPSKITTPEIENGILGNSESIPSKETTTEVEGGIEGSGETLPSIEVTEIIDGGSLAGSSANNSSEWNEISDGGSLASGIVPPELVYIPLGGSISGGEADHSLYYIGNGGAILGGMAFKGSTEYATGGSRSSGVADTNFVGNILIDGGSKLNGSSTRQYTYNPVLVGRCTAGGLSRVTHIIKSITITASGVLIKGFINGVGIGEVASGGTRLGGTAISFVIDSVNGGSKASGKAIVSKSTNSARPTGNSLAGGITKPSLKTIISVSGGIEANGIALIGWTLPVAFVDDTVGYGTSIVISGEADYYKSLLSFIGKGGITIQGTASFEVTVSDYSYESEATSIELRGTVIATLYYNNDRNCLIPCKVVDKIARNVRTRCVQPIIVAGEEKRVLNGTVKKIPSLAVLPAIVACRQKLF